MRQTLSEAEATEIFDEEHENYTLANSEGWTSEGKYEFCDKIFKDKNGLYWRVSASRTGSYYTDYYQQVNLTIVQVEPKESIIIKWVEVENED